MSWCKIAVTLVLLSLCASSLLVAANRSYWENAGCHLVGYVKNVNMAGCHRATVHMNACRGYCLTSSLLAPYDQRTSSLLYKSHGRCCSIQTTHNVIVYLKCENNETRQVVFRSAATCACNLCSHD